jgi:hypothetical protein
MPMQFAMMAAAQWNGKLVTYLAGQGAALRKTQVMRISLHVKCSYQLVERALGAILLLQRLGMGESIRKPHDGQLRHRHLT